MNHITGYIRVRLRDEDGVGYWIKTDTIQGFYEVGETCNVECMLFDEEMEEIQYRVIEALENAYTVAQRVQDSLKR